MLKTYATIAAAAVSTLLSVAAQAQAQAVVAPQLSPEKTHATFMALPPHTVEGVQFAKTGKNLLQWNGSFTDLKGHKITYTMVGADPSTSNVTSTVKTLIIPIKMVYGTSNGNKTFDPLVDTVSNGKNVIDNMLASPLFVSGVDFNQGGIDLGKTQYIDAYQRGNFWSEVSTNTGYHTILKTSVMPEQTITVTAAQGHVENNPFASGVVGTMDINSFDAQLQTFLAQIKKVKPNVLPLFITDNIFLTSGGCCIGGYHSANAGQPAGQTYGYSTYVTSPGSFSQDVSAISHEIGEWMDDPFTNNHVFCTDNSIMENGDPLEGRTNYGGFPYALNGFTYNLQSLVFIGYFGAPPATSANSWLSFQNDEKAVCPGQ